ncbi:hypothetical protein IVB18_05350 [Bradyrhizobium sp. 186]|uniref:hypothetical protein n=1 Tax=Bradyrhizobium sp. 186 TaxID=2782654 RepID=UPI002001B72C|nr:hypothetical protein [Bradyrhizobium sp. 186]UPK31870.1 hypothetical protein IVB18_26450 [Bradyrhizobium sp. 186]UPK36776.1 hypothetical protein IVB18_05350 [Bradyrhizobium sp. 186]
MSDVFGNRPEDFLNRGLKAAVGTLPVVGGPLNEFLAFVIGDPAQERRDDFMKATLERLIALEASSERLRPENLRDNEQFQATFIQAVRLATTTASAEKKKLLQNAIINSAIGHVDETVRMLFIQMLDGITPMHAVLLAFLDNPRGNPAAIRKAESISLGGALVHLIDAAFPEIQSNGELLNRVVADLNAMGLTTSSGIQVMMTGSGLLERRSTDLGRSFLAFVSDPETKSVP